MNALDYTPRYDAAFALEPEKLRRWRYLPESSFQAATPEAARVCPGRKPKDARVAPTAISHFRSTSGLRNRVRSATSVVGAKAMDNGAEDLCAPCVDAADSKPPKVDTRSGIAANPEKGRAYAKSWRAKNPEKAKASREKYRREKPEKVKATRSAQYAKNAEKARAYGVAYRLANPEKYRETYKSSRAKNLEKARGYCSQWKKNNPEKHRTYEHNRRARKVAAGGKLSPDLGERLFKLQKGRCACCKKPLGKNFHLDHIMPLALGGDNSDRNIQLLRAECNQQKYASHPIDFMRSRGMLL